MKITLLVPCWNEEKSLEKSIASWLNQTRPFNEIVVVNDASTDNTLKILTKYKDKIKIVTAPKRFGNKSHAQEHGLQFVTGTVIVTTDGDTQLDKNFCKRIEIDFKDPKVAAVAGYVRSLKYNWLTACRAMDYVVGNNIDKLAQSYIGYVFVIPGAAAAFKTSVFKKHIGFDHDTVTEDLDFTYKLHKKNQKILYDRKAICLTQDPPNLDSYVNQMRRWYGGGWQNLKKHITMPNRPGMALELTLIYGEGLIFSMLLFIVPFLNFAYAVAFTGLYSITFLALAIYASLKEKRYEFLIILPVYIFLKYVNAYVFLEQFVKEIVLQKKNLTWYTPERVQT